ncbi:hypothetical protein ACJBT8_10450, partial [Streptococcus suis]
VGFYFDKPYASLRDFGLEYCFHTVFVGILFSAGRFGAGGFGCGVVVVVFVGGWVCGGVGV